MREEHSAFGMVRMWQRQEPGRKYVLSTYFFGPHTAELVPRDALSEFGTHTLLNRFTTRHRHARSGAIDEVVPLFEQVLLPAHHRSFIRFHPRQHSRKRLSDIDRHVTACRAV